MMYRPSAVSSKRPFRQITRPKLRTEHLNGDLPCRRKYALFTSMAIIVISVSISCMCTSALSFSQRRNIIQTSTMCRNKVSYSSTFTIIREASNRCVLYEGQNPDHDERIPSAIPVDPLPTSQYVQQEQLLEVVSRIGADSISLLSIPERTKRAMLAEAVEDEIFSCTEQLIDLVNEQLDHDSSNINSSQSSLNQRQKKDIANKIIDLRERNQFLQAQYNDLVSGRSSSLLNTVNSVGVSTNQLDGLNSPTDNDGRPRNNDNDEANNTQFN